MGGNVAPAEPRHRGDRRPRRAEPPQQRVERDRADRLGAAEAQPVEAFLGVELARGQGRLSPS
jgi:hypothetical protein